MKIASSLCLALVLALVAISFSVDPNGDSLFTRLSKREDDHRALFEAWTLEHGKVYSSAQEKENRFQIFKSSLARQKVLNKRTMARGSGALYGTNKFSDMTPEEFQSKILMNKRPSTPKDSSKVGVLTPTDIPQAIDWRDKKAVTPVKDQGQCGSCWAFSATETIESAWILKHGLTGQTMAPLSPQQIVDCDTTDGGCNGGNTPTAYQYVMGAGGLDTSAQYPYTAEDGKCSEKQPTYATITNWNYATNSDDEEAMRQVTAQQGPISICLDAANWQDYTSGVMTAWECAWINQLDHCVQAVGYNLTASPQYWIVRNSWGTSWGINGYILLEYGANTCGLTEEPTYVTSA